MRKITMQMKHKITGWLLIISLLIACGTAMAIGVEHMSAMSNIVDIAKTADIQSLAKSITDMAQNQGSGSAIVYVMSLIAISTGILYWRQNVAMANQAREYQATLIEQHDKSLEKQDKHLEKLDRLADEMHESNLHASNLVTILNSRPCVHQDIPTK